MSETFDLIHLLILLAAGVLVVPAFYRFGLGSVLGYIFAGIIVGPWGLGVIHQVEKIQHIAEFGVVFLLFVIGIVLLALSVIVNVVSDIIVRGVRKEK